MSHPGDTAPIDRYPRRTFSRLAPLLVALAAACATPATSESSPGHPHPQTRPAAEQPAGSSAEDLAKKLANPIANLISVPFQFNFDRGYGPGDDGERYNVNVQPVVPIDLDEKWNLISRTILPIVYINDVVPGDSEFGLGDTLQSLFFSPKEPTSGGIIWGAGLVFQLPTATDDTLGSDKLGLGPTVVVLKQIGPWTVGGLANHIWSVAGDDDRPDVNATFVQPFASYTTKEAWTYTGNFEATYDWREDELSLPLNLTVSKVTKLGDQLVSIGGGLRYWIDTPDGGPEGLGFRLIFTLLFPR